MNKTVFVTGSSRGIGRAIALAFGTRGWNVAVNCVNNTDMLENLSAEIVMLGGQALAVPCDVSDLDALRTAVETATDRFGSLDVLVNNAGVAYTGLFNLMKQTDWRRLIDVNIAGVLNATRLILPGMLARRTGVVINISSIWGQTGASCEAVYSMTKGAVDAFTKALAKEAAPNGVRVNAIACGVINTDMNANLSESELTELVNRIPAGRAGTPEDVAGFALFLASEEAAYLTGQIITLDGGMI